MNLHIRHQAMSVGNVSSGVDEYLSDEKRRDLSTDQGKKRWDVDRPSLGATSQKRLEPDPGGKGTWCLSARMSYLQESHHARAVKKTLPETGR